MIRRLLLLVAAPVVAILAIGPVLDRIAARLMAAPRRLPEEAGMAPALDRLGGEVVRLRSRDGLRLAGRWLHGPPPAGPSSAPAADASPVSDASPASDAQPPASDAQPPASDAQPPAWSRDPHEAILLLHGYSGSITPDLVELGPFLRETAAVLGLDLRGHGGSDDAPTTFGLREVDDVAGALTWLGERGIRRVALVGSSMGGVTAIAAVALLGDGRLAAADVDPDAPAAAIAAPRPRVVAVVGESVTPELAVVVASRMRVPLGRRIAGQAFGRMAKVAGGDPRDVEPIAVVGLLEDVPLLLVIDDADRTLPVRDARRLLAAAPDGTRHLEIEGADHSRGHATDPEGYEAAVTSFLRDAFRATRPDEGEPS